MCMLKWKKDIEEIENSHREKLMLERDYKEKEERIKCEEEWKNKNIRVRENSSLKHCDRHFEEKKWSA